MAFPNVNLEAHDAEAFNALLEIVKTGMLRTDLVPELGFANDGKIADRFSSGVWGSEAAIVQLFRNMYDHAQYHFEHFLDRPFYLAAERELTAGSGGRYVAELLQINVGRTPMTAGLVIFDKAGGNAYALRGGMDYDWSEYFTAYDLLVVQTIIRAFHHGSKRLWFGPTAIEAKVKFGAQPFNLRTYSRFHVGPFSGPVSAIAGRINRRTTRAFELNLADHALKPRPVEEPPPPPPAPVTTERAAPSTEQPAAAVVEKAPEPAKPAASKAKVSGPTLAIKGSEIQEALGIKPGPEIGRILKALTALVAADSTLNDHDRLLALVREKGAAGLSGESGGNSSANSSPKPS
jgi:hypothetical protein